MDAIVKKSLNSVSSFFTGGDQLPLRDRDIISEALIHLAHVDLIDLCNEAKVERCRAVRDLSSCGRNVQHVLISCGHASLCAECSEHYDFCPICRIPLPKNGNRLKLRLYYECVEAGLIYKQHGRFVEEEDNEQHADVERLYSFFDVAMRNNLISLVCHYVTDICMDESAVSSDPVISFLLDEVVVKDWCKRTFRNIVSKIQVILDSLEEEKMESELSVLLKFSTQLAGISSVLEVLESSFKGTLSAHLHDIHHLQESILKSKQHMEIMIWCLRNQFLKNVRSRHANVMSWCSLVCERKSAAIKRSFPDPVNSSSEISVKSGSLFIEDALLNLEIEKENTQEFGEETLITFLHKDGVWPVFRSKIEGSPASYPFENLRAATDVLFLHGSSGLVVAKRAIFLYYLFDRHWSMPDKCWRHIVDDFAATFGIGRHSLLECFTFYLLDDHTDEALQEACRLLPEISGQVTHPKIAQVLLERRNPDAALMVLRCSGRDDGAQLVSLGEAVIAVRVKVECGLLTEAFMYQRMICTKAKERKFKHGSCGDDLDDEFRNWLEWVEALVTEICLLCVRRNLVDRMLDLPWNLDEEKYLQKCLFDYAIIDPSSATGSLLVVFYIRRYRYIEAYQTDQKLQAVEQDFISKNNVSEEVLYRMQSVSHWRANLVERFMSLLPEAQMEQVKNGKFPVADASPAKEAPMMAESYTPNSPDPNDLPVIFQMDPTATQEPWVSKNVTNHGRNINSYGSPSILQRHSFTKGERERTPPVKNTDFGAFCTRRTRGVNTCFASPLKEVGRSASRATQNGYHNDDQLGKAPPEEQEFGFSDGLLGFQTPYSQMAKPVSTFSKKSGMLMDSARDFGSDVSAKHLRSDKRERSLHLVSDPMEASWSDGVKRSTPEDMAIDARPRWRSDETSDDEEVSPRRIMGATSDTTPAKGGRRSRFTRR